MFLVGRVVVFGGESLSFNPLPMNQVTWVSSFCCGFVKGKLLPIVAWVPLLSPGLGLGRQPKCGCHIQ